jgi:hypothetical protein
MIVGYIKFHHDPRGEGSLKQMDEKRKQIILVVHVNGVRLFL